MEAGAAFCWNTQWLTPGYPFFPGPLLVLSRGRRRACRRLKQCLMSTRYSVLTETLTGQAVFLKCFFFHFCSFPLDSLPTSSTFGVYLIRVLQANLISTFIASLGIVIFKSAFTLLHICYQSSVEGKPGSLLVLCLIQNI